MPKPGEFMGYHPASLKTKLRINGKKLTSRLWDDPLGFIKVGAVISPILAAADGLFIKQSFRWFAVEAIAGYSLWPLMDLYKRSANFYGKFHPFRSTSNRLFMRSKFEKLVGEEPAKEITYNALRFNDAKGSYRVTSIKPMSSIRDDGAGAYKGDYAAVITLSRSILGGIIDHFFHQDNPKEVKFIHKYSKKHHAQNLEREGLITRVLTEQGLEIAPVVFSRQRKHKQDMYLSERLNVGVAYEYIKGDSLEDMLYARTFDGDYISYGAESPHLKPSFTKEVDEIFDLMFKAYSHSHLKGDTLNRTLFCSSMNNLSDHGKTKLELDSDDFWDYKDIVKKARESAVKMMGFEPCASKFEFHEKLVEKLEKYDPKFASELKSCFSRYFNYIEPVLIHGDFQPGNVLIKNDNPVVIDWDNARLGIPYEDFFYFSAVSGFENNPEYLESRKKFLERQEKETPIGSLGEDSLTLLEFETYMSLLDRYNKAVETGHIKETCRRHVSLSCKNILGRARNSLEKYVSLSGNTSILDSFKKMADNKYSRLYDLEEDDKISEFLFKGHEIPFAHVAYHGMREKEKEVVEANSIEEQSLTIKKITSYQNKINGLNWISFIYIAGGLGFLGSVISPGVVMPYLDSEFYNSNIPDSVNMDLARSVLRATGTALTIFGLSGIAYASILKDRINYIARGK